MLTCCHSVNTPNRGTLQNAVFKEIVQHFGDYAFLLSCKLDRKIEATSTLLHFKSKTPQCNYIWASCPQRRSGSETTGSCLILKAAPWRLTVVRHTRRSLEMLARTSFVTCRTTVIWLFHGRKQTCMYNACSTIHTGLLRLPGIVSTWITSYRCCWFCCLCQQLLCILSRYYCSYGQEERHYSVSCDSSGAQRRYQPYIDLQNFIYGLVVPEEWRENLHVADQPEQKSAFACGGNDKSAALVDVFTNVTCTLC